MNLKKPWRKALGAATAALALAISTLLPATSAHAAPAAGTVIGNQASATYRDASNTERSTTSNLVQTTVSQVKSYTLTADGNQTASPGQTVYFPHTITNTGNGTDSYALNAATGAAGVPTGFTPAGLQYFTDANGDGVPDNATAITSSTPVPAGGQFRFVVAAVVPGGAAIGAIGKVTVNVSDGVTPRANEDTITVATSAVSVTKSLDITSGASPRAGVVVTLRYTNSGTAAASNLEITDVLPSGMTYVTTTGVWSGAALTDAVGGDPAGIDYSAVTVGGVTTVTAKIVSVPAGASGDVKFTVNIASGLAPTTSGNQAATTNFATYKTLTQAGPLSTNNALYTVLQTASVALSGSATVPGDIGVVNAPSPAAQGSVVSFPIFAYNTGNGTDTLNISSAGIGSFPPGTTFQVFRGDQTTPLIDTNGDGTVDTGPLAPSTTVPMALYVKATLPASGAVPAGPYAVTFTATSAFNAAVTDPVSLSLAAITQSSVDVTIDYAYGQAGALGEAAGTATAVKTDPVTPLQSASSTWVFKMYVNNRGGAADAYNLSLQSAAPAGWSVAFRASTAGSCATLGSSITSTGSIAGGGSLLVCAVVTVPSIQSNFAAPGVRDFELLARSASNPAVSNDYAKVAINLATVNSVSLSPNGMQQTYAGAPVTYTHSVANLGNTAQTVTFTASFLTDAQVAAGWTSSAYIDSNDNGVFEPGTDPLVTTSSAIGLAVAANKTIFVRVFAPGSATSANPANVTTLTATYTGGTTSATDTTAITDGLLLLKEQVATSCSVTPAGGYTSNPIPAGAATAPGQCIGYRITATNTTAQTITNVVLSDTVPANTTLSTGCGAPASPTAGVTMGGTATNGNPGTVTATIPSLGANAAFTATFCVKIDQ